MIGTFFVSLFKINDIVVFEPSTHYECFILVSGFKTNQNPKQVLQQVRDILQKWTAKPAVLNFFVVTDLP